MSDCQHCDASHTISILQLDPRMTSPLHTHYETLKVVRSAPLEVIKASYRALSQKYHPDRNRDPDAAQRMSVINQAWDVLSDAGRRASHDEWIRIQEAKLAVPGAAHKPPPATAPADMGQTLVLAAYLFNKYEITEVAPPGEELVVVAAQAPAAAIPQPARIAHGYLGHEGVYPGSGPAMLELDNSAGTADAEVRLFRNGQPMYRVFVHQGLRFTLPDLPLGTYTLHYRVQQNGQVLSYRATQEHRLVPTETEVKEGRYNKFSKARNTRFAIGIDQAVEIQANEF
jgi:hypothetical protein